jgi:hypothetical protein
MDKSQKDKNDQLFNLLISPLLMLGQTFSRTLRFGILNFSHCYLIVICNLAIGIY